MARNTRYSPELRERAVTMVVEPIPGEDHIAAMSEGWIAVPLEGSLTELPRL